MMETIPSGTVLHGRYRIERVLGSGGFGHVYLAIDLATQQQYAIKEYLVTGPTGQEQLQHEATVLSRLHHPNLPAFHDAFMERGRYYIVINYLEGNDLTDLIRMTRQRNEAIPLARIMTWLLGICDAVIFMHRQQPPFIHRDIKPDNIRITPEGTAILVDLGNVKAAADGVRTLFFIRHQGTPGYAPPEQYPGGVGTDTRSDIYALGGTLYFALTTLEPPSVSVRNQSIQQGQADLPSLQEVLAKNPPEDSLEANAARQFRLGVSKPSKPAPRHSRHVAQLGMLPPELLNQLNNIIQRAMAMRPKNRYQNAADFANDLRRVLNALPPSTEPPTRRPVDPHSTQPDLPMLYESLQTAKENAGRDRIEQSTSPMSAPATPSAPAIRYCPRCNTALAPNAAFCSECGLSLNNSGPSNSPGARSQKSNPSPKGDISTHQTAVVSPQSQEKTTGRTPGPQIAGGPQSSSSRLSLPRPQQGATGSPAPHAVSTAVQPAPSLYNNSGDARGPQIQVAPTRDDDNSAARGFTLKPNIVIFAFVLLVILILLALFVLHLGHH